MVFALDKDKDYQEKDCNCNSKLCTKLNGMSTTIETLRDDICELCKETHDKDCNSNLHTRLDEMSKSIETLRNVMIQLAMSQERALDREEETLEAMVAILDMIKKEGGGKRG